MNIRPATREDFDQIWLIFHEIAGAGETYGYPRNISNEGAVRLWTKLGFETVGRIPKAFNHPSKAFVDTLVMYKWLDI